MLLRTLLVGLALLAAGATLAPAADAQLVVFEQHLAPIIQAQCVECHNSKTHKGELDLSSRAGVLKGGESGATVVPGKLDDSVLYTMLHEGLMPPPGKPRLKPEQVELFATWIKSGAKFAESTASAPPPVEQLSQHDILPILLVRCTVCHGRRTQEAGLDLRTKAAMLKGGKSGPAIVLGKPTESLLIRKIHSGEMPPNKRLQEASVKPITSDETDKLARWIAAGAPEIDMQPDVATTAPDPLVADEDRQWWSFQPPRDQVPPAVKSVARISNPIDRFVLAKLENVGLDFAPEADPVTLCRRLYYDLTGLPPTPEEMADWEAKLKAESRKLGINDLRNSAAFSSQLSAFCSRGQTARLTALRRTLGSLLARCRGLCR